MCSVWLPPSRFRRFVCLRLISLLPPYVLRATQWLLSEVFLRQALCRAQTYAKKEEEEEEKEEEAKKKAQWSPDCSSVRRSKPEVGRFRDPATRMRRTYRI